ncbi:MAG: hypothetical protein F6J90_17910 [Moorea sp. SIOASIH]|nr:hypothetical protein [Moorena sp. SIOASIH]
MQKIFNTSKHSVVSGQWSVVSGQVIFFKSTSKWHRLPACDLTHKLITNS